VASDRNRSQTASIEVCLPLNFAVVFDFMNFRFRPSKAKSIGIGKTRRIVRQRELKKSAEELRMGIPLLRQ
jgi:hypothetical protein